MLRVLILVAAMLVPQIVDAACNGRDLRDSLTPVQRAAFNTEMKAVPYPNGNHWLATRGTHRVHLIGTVHMDDPRLDPIAVRLQPIIANADLLMVEATDTEEAQLQDAIATRPDLVSLWSGPTLIDMMPPADWAKLAEAARARGIPPFMAAKLKPWYLSLVLGMPPCVLAQMQAGKRGLDHRILDIASDSNVPGFALEPFDTLFTLIGRTPMDEQVDLLRLGVLSVQQSEDAIATLAEQYFDQRHGAVMPMNRVLIQGWMDMPEAQFDAAFAQMLDVLLDQRNAAWLPRIIATEGTVVVAVGAGHLSGRGGLLQLLEDAGYTLDERPF